MFCVTLIAAGVAIAQAPDSSPRAPNQSPASKPRPKSATQQTYPVEQVRDGEVRFAAQCGFCHGRDAAGESPGRTSPRTEFVAEDSRGDKIGPLVREGRPNAGMPAFRLSDADLSAIVTFLHSQMDKLATLGGGRRGVDPPDLSIGNIADGRAYFKGAGGCSGCHSPTSDLAGVATRYQGLALLRRMLYPSGRPAPAPPRAIFTLPSGQTISAPLAGEMSSRLLYWIRWEHVRRIKKER